MSAIVCAGGPSPLGSPTNAPLSHRSASAGVSIATLASSCAFARILPVALTIAPGVPSDGLVLKPWPVPKRFSSAGTTLTSRAGTPSSSATICAYSSSLPSDSVVRLSTIFPVGWTRRNTARYASSATVFLRFDPLSLLMCGQRVVLLQVAERRLGSAKRMRRHRGSFAAGVDAGLHGLVAHPIVHPGVVLPLLGP